MISLPAKDRRALWYCFRGIQLQILPSANQHSSVKVIPCAIQKVLLGQEVKHLEPFTVQSIREHAEQQIRWMGNGEFACAFRAYRHYLDFSLWQAAAKRAGVRLTWVRHVIEGKNNSQNIISALEAELVARELVRSDTPTRRKLISTPSQYSGVYSRVAKKFGVSRQLVRRVALGEQQSASIAAALALEMLTIERRAQR